MTYTARQRIKNLFDLFVWVLIILSVVQGCTWFFSMAEYENTRYERNLYYNH